MKKILGQIFDDMRVRGYHHKDPAGKTWYTCECIYCNKQKVVARPKILERIGTTCGICTNRKGNILREDEDKILDDYVAGMPVKVLAHEHSVSLRSVYNVLKRRATTLRRKRDDIAVKAIDYQI